MKCIEFIGVPASGKSFYKKKFEKKFNCISKQRLIINFFLKKRKNNFKNKFICYLIIFYYSNFTFTIQLLFTFIFLLFLSPIQIVSATPD